MSYFKEQEFELREDPSITKAPPKDIEQINEEALREAIKSIRSEFEAIALGDSDLCHYKINPEGFASPVRSSLSALEQKPSFKRMREFLQVAEQDLGYKAKEHFKSLLEGAIKQENTNEQ